jgi:DNA-binding MarR family transcriptional regulator
MVCPFTSMPPLMIKDLPRYECLLAAAREFPDLDPSAVEAVLHLLRAGDEVFGAVERGLAEHQVSPGRFGVLMLLWRRRLKGGAAHTPATLAEAAGVTRATMTGLIDTLERDGLVRRASDASDRRMWMVNLTPKGDDFLRQMLPDHFKRVAALMQPLAESERALLVRLLGKVAGQVASLSEAEQRRSLRATA